MNKAKLEAQLSSLKKQNVQTNSFIELMQSQFETAIKINFDSRAKSLGEILEQEVYFQSIINLKIQKCLNQLKKFV